MKPNTKISGKTVTATNAKKADLKAPVKKSAMKSLGIIQNHNETLLVS